MHPNVPRSELFAMRPYARVNILGHCKIFPYAQIHQARIMTYPLDPAIKENTGGPTIKNKKIVPLRFVASNFKHIV